MSRTFTSQSHPLSGVRSGRARQALPCRFPSTVACARFRDKAVIAPPYNVLITGSTKGVGLALAEEFLEAGTTNLFAIEFIPQCCQCRTLIPVHKSPMLTLVLRIYSYMPAHHMDTSMKNVFALISKPTYPLPRSLRPVSEHMRVQVTRCSSALEQTLV